MANPLRETFELVIASYAEWVKALKDPWLTAARLLAGTDRTEQVKRATGFWFSAFFMSVVISLPIYVSFGLKLENLSFQLCAVVAQYTTLIGITALLHISLRRHRIPSVSAETFTLYTVTAAAAGPIITLLSLPALFRSLRITADVKIHKLSFIKAAQEMLLATVRIDNSVSSILLMALQPIILLVSVFVMATLVQLLAEHYGVSEATTLRAIAFAGGVLFPALTAVVVVLQQLLLFAFITTGA